MMNCPITGLANKAILVIFLVLAGSVFCNAQEAEPIETDRPSATQSPKVIPHKTVQIEAGALYTRNSGHKTELTTLSYPSALLRVGVFKRAELRVSGFNREHTTFEFAGKEFKNDGFGPVSVGTKVQLFHQKGARPQAAIIAEVELSSGTEGFRTSEAEPKLALALGNKLNDKLTLNYTVGYKFNDLDETDYQYAVELQVELTNKISLYGEAFGGKPEDSPFQQSADAGLLFKARNNLQFDIAAGTGFTDDAADLFVTAGLSFRFPN